MSGNANLIASIDKNVKSEIMMGTVKKFMSWEEASSQS